MKHYSKYIIAAVILSIIVAGCMELINFSHPKSAPVNTDVNVGMEIKYDLEGFDRTAQVIVAMLLPTQWNADAVTATYSSGDMRGGPYENMPMRRTTPEEIDPASHTEWSAALKDRLGTFGNYDPVRWIVFIGEETHEWKIGDSFTAKVNLKFKTGADNILVNLAYFVSNSVEGVHNDNQYYIVKDCQFETTGADNPLIDYTVPKMCSSSPEQLTYEDIIRINFNATILVEDEDSPLKGADEVYFMAKATCNNETKSVEVYETGKKTRMYKEDTDRWFFYFYPHEYFSIPAEVKIDHITYFLTNKDKSKVVRLLDGSDFNINEYCK